MWSALLALALTTPGSGNITGELLFPGCEIPEDLEVCAEKGDETVCTKNFRFENGTLAYTLKVPAGAYQVFARSAQTLPGVKAYYTQAVECGLSIECKNHAPIIVDVQAAKTVAGVHPADWTEPAEPELITLADHSAME